jgi:hypothetical protein
MASRGGAAARKRTPGKRVLPNSMVDEASKPDAHRVAADCVKALVAHLGLPGGNALRDDPAVGHMAHAAISVLCPAAARAVPAAAGGISAVALLAKLNPAPSKNPLPRYPRGIADWTDSSDEDENPGK